MDGRTFWYPEDARWLAWERVVILGEEFGPAAVAVLTALKGEAKLQNAGWQVKAGYHSIARAAFVPVDEVRRIVVRAAEIDALDDLQEAGFTFVCRVSGMAASEAAARAEERRVRDADRKARERHTSPDVSEPVRGCPDLSDDVPKSPPIQKRREQKNNNNPVEPDGSTRVGDEVSELFAYWQQQCGHLHAKLTADRRRKIGARLREGYTPEQVRQAVDGAAKAAFVSEDGRRHDDIELICRTGTKLESFISRTANGHVSEHPWDFVDRLNAGPTQVPA